jgi:signal peptidase I
VQKSPDGRNEVLRKPAVKQTAMKMFVHDDAHPAKELLAAEWPESWQALSRDGDVWQPDPHGWEAHREKRTYNISGKADEPLRWLRYQHYIPTYDDWESARAGQSLRTSPNREPLLITDFYPYNSEDVNTSFGREMLGDNWVGDLCLSCKVDVAVPQGSLVLELVESKRRYRCEIDLTSGQAELYYYNDALTGTRADDDSVDSRVAIGKVQTVMNRAGRYRLRLSNFDNRLGLWINNRVVPLPQSGDYSFDPRSDYSTPTNEDLCPVGIAARGAELQVSDLRIDRDVFYTQGRVDQPKSRYQLANPQEYARAAEAEFDPLSYALGPDEFFAMGDNSPRSADSRWWTAPDNHADTLRNPAHPWAVHRSLLIGKAFMIYWPHGVPFGNDGKGIPVQYHDRVGQDKKGNAIPVRTDYPSFVVPFYPQFSRFKFIH